MPPGFDHLFELFAALKCWAKFVAPPGLDSRHLVCAGMLRNEFPHTGANPELLRAAVAAELRSAWTGEGARPYTSALTLASL